MFNESNRALVHPTNGNEYFIDRNGYAFRYVLEYYRTGKILWTKDNTEITQKELITEFDYFKIPNNLQKESKTQEDQEQQIHEELKLLKEKFARKEREEEQIREELRMLKGELARKEREEQQTREELKTLIENLTQKESEGETRKTVELIQNRLKIKPIHNLATVNELAATLDAFYDAIKDVIYETNRNYRKSLFLWFYLSPGFSSRKSNEYVSIMAVEPDIDSVINIMKPFRASGYGLLYDFHETIERKLREDFSGLIVHYNHDNCSDNLYCEGLIIHLKMISAQSILQKSNLNS
jgi:hypothetical protein